jgi:hypothetical protein
MIRKKKAVKFFNPKVHTGWHKTQSATYRRRLSLKAHKSDYLATARSLQALSNTTRDKQTKVLSKRDANYFFAMNRKHKR